MLRLPLTSLCKVVYSRTKFPHVVNNYLTQQRTPITHFHHCELFHPRGYSQSTVPLSKIVQESRSLPNKKKSAKKNKLQLQKTSYNRFEVGPVFTDEEGLSFSIEELLKVEENFSQPKSVLFNSYSKVATVKKDPNIILRPVYKKLGSGVNLQWKVTYSLKWPECKDFSGIGSSRSEAEKWACLSALHWLVLNGHMHPTGYPVLCSKEELADLKKAALNGVPVKVPSQLITELEDLVQDFQCLKIKLEADASTFESSAANSLISDKLTKDPLEELEEEIDLDESLRFPALPEDNGLREENSDVPIDVLTGYRCPPLTLAQLQRRNEQLLNQTHHRSSPPVLPILEKRDAILKLIEENRVVVLSGDTGCGKSTQMPQYLLDSFALQGRGAECNIIVTQPRRLAALSLAQTVAKNRGEKLGESVGYQVRLNKVLPQQRGGCVLFCSTGILLRKLQANPELDGISHLVIDEVHERDCMTDFTLIILKDLLRTNSSLKVILMSASLNAELLSRYFDSAPLIHVSGRTFPVQQHFLPYIEQVIGSSRSERNMDRGRGTKPFVDLDLAFKLIRHIDLNKPTEGAILCFLPGWADIKSLHSKLKEFYPSEETHWILPVHSRLSQKEQERIFDRPPQHVRKIVIATNIAETSLTINDVVYVIDPGVHKELRYNLQRGSAMIDNQWIAKANVKQRAGRAGRVQPGESYHLYPKERFEEMEQFPVAEILQIPLEKVIMDIKAYDENLNAVEFLGRALEPPSHQAIKDAIDELETIGALDENERLTALGRRISKFTTHPRLAKALVYATLFRCLDPVTSVVSSLSSSREGWSIDSTVENQRQVTRKLKRLWHSTSDHVAFSNLMKQFNNCSSSRYQVDEFCYQYKVNPKAMYFLKGVKKLLVDHVVEAGLLTERQNTENYNHPVNDNSKNEEIVKVALLMGIGDRLLRVRKGRLVKGIFKSDESIIISEKHGPIHVASDSVNGEALTDADYIMFFNGVFSTERRAFVVRDTSQISPLVALLASGNRIHLSETEEGTVLTVDARAQIKFACSSRDAKLLVELRQSLSATSDYLLRTVGVRAHDQLTREVSQYYSRQVDLLARLLLSQSKSLDQN